MLLSDEIEYQIISTSILGILSLFLQLVLDHDDNMSNKAETWWCTDAN